MSTEIAGFRLDKYTHFQGTRLIRKKEGRRQKKAIPNKRDSASLRRQRAIPIQIIPDLSGLRFAGNAICDPYRQAGPVFNHSAKGDFASQATKS